MSIKDSLLNLKQKIKGTKKEAQEKATLEDADKSFLSATEALHEHPISEGSTTTADSDIILNKIEGSSAPRISNRIFFSVDLDDKVDAFINWYFKKMVKWHYTAIGECRKPKEMRDFIEEMAVWYELRYPDYEVNRMMPCTKQEKTEIDNVMFRNNSYINDLLGNDSDTRELEWDKFYSREVFIKSLPIQKKVLLSSPRYREVVNLDIYSSRACLHLSKEGIVEEAEGISIWTNYIIRDEELTGLHVKKVLELFRAKGIELPKNNELEETIMTVDNWTYQKEEILNCVMYRIIERGGIRIGPRRALIFAKEFKRSIDVPMMYGIDYSDPGLRTFINEYIKAGGSTSLECLVGYFERTNKKTPLKRVTVEELLMYNKEYTKEEDELHQRLVNILASQIDSDEVKKEEVKRLRLERKLEKSRINKK